MSLSNNEISLEHTNDKEHLFSSERYHREAIYNFEKTLIQKPKSIGALCDWIASYHELATIYGKQGAIEKAQKCLLIPHQSMLHMALYNGGDIEQKEIAMRAINVTLPALMSFANAHPPCKNCMKNLEAQLEMIQKHSRMDH
ncbi:hypothetical protein ACLKMH_09965 [Psychromonas sp. KJ10-10]|uniref:hypothetical protein n=1 Tax=Psychromonas sp. KJ10-10 TaxID=3391823 RepID=UPI0039B61E51